VRKVSASFWKEGPYYIENEHNGRCTPKGKNEILVHQVVKNSPQNRKKNADG